MRVLIPGEFMRKLPLAAALLFLAAAGQGWCQADIPEPASDAVKCDLPPALTTPDEELRRVAAAIAARGQVEILAIGSGSTVGESNGAGGTVIKHPPKSSFAYRMIEALEELKPSVGFHLTVKGGRNMTAEDMLPLLRQELAAHQYDLVLWQTGTVEAVRGLRPEAMRDVMRDGADLAAADGADVVLVDPQFSRFLRANTDLAPYDAALQEVAAMPGVTLFHRFELTHNWAAGGDIDLEQVSPEARDRTIAKLNICLGRALAEFVLAGTSDSQPH
jgi:acyl-CoA thioesterase I